MAAKGQLTVRTWPQNCSFYRVVLWLFKTYKPSEAKSSLCALFLFLHLLQYVKGRSKTYAYIPDSESCGDMSIYLRWTRLLFVVKVIYGSILRPCVPKQYLQCMSKNIQGRPLTSWLKNELKIRRNAKLITFLCVYLHGGSFW